MMIVAVEPEFIERRDRGYYFIGSRVSLESAVYQFLQGESPEGIAQAYPSLSLLQVYGGITYYLAHRAEIDEYLRQGEARFEELARFARVLRRSARQFSAFAPRSGKSRHRLPARK